MTIAKYLIVAPPLPSLLLRLRSSFFFCLCITIATISPSPPRLCPHPPLVVPSPPHSRNDFRKMKTEVSVIKAPLTVPLLKLGVYICLAMSLMLFIERLYIGVVIILVKVLHAALHFLSLSLCCFCWVFYPKY